MSISKESELIGMQKASAAVASTLKQMINYAQPGVSTKDLGDYGGRMAQHEHTIVITDGKPIILTEG